MDNLPSRCQGGGIILLAFILAVSIVFVSGGSAFGASEQQDSPGTSKSSTTASIVVVPNVANIKSRQVKIYGAGFTPNKRVILEVVGVFKGKVYSGNDVVFAASIPNQYGAFEETLQLRYITRYGVRVGPGVYTVRARTEDGLEATTAPLALTKPKKK